MHFAEAVFREAARLKSTAPLLFFESLTDTRAAASSCRHARASSA